jgi:hypothetical protein
LYGPTPVFCASPSLDVVKSPHAQNVTWELKAIRNALTVTVETWIAARAPYHRKISLRIKRRGNVDAAEFDNSWFDYRCLNAGVH